MAASLDLTTFRAEDGSNTKRRTMGIYSGPASYVAGGDPCVPAEFKLGQVHLVLAESASNGTVVLITRYQVVLQAWKWFDLAGAEIAGGTDLSGYTARFEAIGL